ncbi:disease resistance protein RGA2-like [Pistacia vera]|uniref:disease resistance protein RGA2-like n=1 Tax=Pistacia vera TaxID=55513 RepID=UPI0012638648|nr:disease resistance protein RGA2-like [Pistacia vera]
MAEVILFDAAGKILEVLGSLVAKEIGLASGVKDEIRQLIDTVRTVKAILHDAEEQHSKKNEEVTVWLQRLKDALYDADDLLDDYYTEFQQLREAMNRNTLAKELPDKNRVENVERETHSFVHADKVFWRDEDKNNVIRLLLDSDGRENVLVISIFGLGGLGKTTLAQLVYNDQNIINHFKLRMWVCVCEDFNLKIIMEKIIKSATRKEIEKLEIDQLQECLRKEINGKKYLLVLDDIWNENPGMWDKLKNLLVNGARGSKILVTTRSEQIAKITSKFSSYVYPLRDLDENKSWSLFLQIAFEHGIEPKDSKLVTFAREIVAKCGGVPLVIITIGHLLYGNNNRDHWLHFRDNKMMSIIKNESDILPILKLSYDHLPLHLKQCFIYCALFPKGYKIEKQKLIYLWMAQGFLQASNENQYLEDVGHNTVDSSWKFQTVLHGVTHVRTLLLFESNAFLELDGDFEFSSSSISLRTLDFGELEFKKLPRSIDKLKHLRYLNISYNGYIVALPNSMSRLWNLETLDLSNCLELKELPRDIRKLVNLRHLINEECDSLVGMPYGLGLLTNLLTLSLFVVSKGNSSSSRKRKNGGIEELNGLNNLRGELKIKNLKYVENSSLANLKEKQFLRSLILNWGRSDGEEVEENDEVVLVGLEPNPNLKEITISSFLGVKMCNWLSFLPDLTSISIDKCKKCQYIPMLDQLPYLKSLSLRFLYDLEYISQEPSNNYSSTPSTTFFPSLEELTLYHCPKLEEWWRIDDDDRVGLPSFPCLSKLRIEYCPNLMSMPLYPSIEELTLSRTSSKPLGQTMMLMNRVDPSTSFNSSAPLSTLSFMDISAIPDLESLPVEGMRNLTSLMDLTIWSCPRLTQVHHGIRLDLLMDDMQSQSLRNLYSLKLYSLPKLASLPKGLRYLTSLQDLTVNECYQLELPENEDEDDMPWKGFRSLNSLELSGLPKLVSLPKGLQYLTSL